MLRPVSALILAVLSLGLAPAPLPKPNPTKDDLHKLQGTWVRVQLTIAGKPQRETPGSISIVITGKRMQYPTRADAWQITLDARQKPRVLDVRHLTNKSLLVSYGIYRLEGDTLTILSNDGRSDSVRPASFKAVGPNVWLQVFERKKP